MKVHIEGNLYLESDELQFMIKEYSTIRSGENAGKEIGNTIGYYTSLSSVIKALMRMKLHDSTATNLRELLDDWENIKEWAESLFKEKVA